MATRKKKVKPDLSGITEMINEKKVVKGSHLTVTTYANGRTELEWDDEALARDVHEAIASVEKKNKNEVLAEIRTARAWLKKK